jgi:hypothetical protein
MDENQVASHDDLGVAGMKQITHLPFEPDSMQELVTRYHLPENWMYLPMQAREVRTFHRESSWDFLKREPVAIRLGTEDKPSGRVLLDGVGRGVAEWVLDDQ